MRDGAVKHTEVYHIIECLRFTAEMDRSRCAASAPSTACRAWSMCSTRCSRRCCRWKRYKLGREQNDESGRTPEQKTTPVGAWKEDDSGRSPERRRLRPELGKKTTPVGAWKEDDSGRSLERRRLRSEPGKKATPVGAAADPQEEEEICFMRWSDDAVFSRVRIQHGGG